jgi:hypothetical protein
VLLDRLNAGIQGRFATGAMAESGHLRASKMQKQMAGQHGGNHYQSPAATHQPANPNPQQHASPDKRRMKIRGNPNPQADAVNVEHQHQKQIDGNADCEKAE